MNEPNLAFWSTAVGTSLAFILAIFSYLFWRRWQRETGLFVQGLQKIIRGQKPEAWPKEKGLSQTLKDLSQKIHHYQALINQYQEEINRWKLIARELEEGLILIDNEKHILWANTSAERILGVSLIEGHSLKEILRHRECQFSLEVTPQEFEVELFWPVPRQIRIRVLKIAPEMWAIFLKDITPFRRLAQVRRDLVAHMAHEIRTPLTAIAGYAENLLAEEPQDPWTAEQLNIILRHARRLGKLVEDLLLLSRLETKGLPEEEKTEVSLEEILKSASEVILPQAQEKGVRLKQYIKADRLPLIKGHRDLLVQAVINLLDNAVKFSPPRGIVEIFLEETPEEWKIGVRDHGPGISDSEKDRIFERFYRGKRGGKGTGLGLALVKHIVLAHEGRVEVESEVGSGATFFIYLSAWKNNT